MPSRRPDDADARLRRPFEKKIADAFVAAVAHLRREVFEDAVEGLDVIEQTESIPVDAVFERYLYEPLTALFEDAAKRGMRAATVKAPTGFDWTLADQIAHEWAQMHAGQLVIGLTSRARKALREVLALGVRENHTIAEIAKNLRRVVGLTPRDAKSVARMRRALIRSGVSASEAERRVGRRADTLVRRRATTIARTESAFAIENGKLTEWRILVAQGDLPSSVRRKWIGRDPCPFCRELARAAAVPLGQPFRLRDGREVMHPPLHPRCLPGDALVSAGGRVPAYSKRWHDGHLVVVRTASGQKLAATPNHPVLTDLGWMPIHEVDERRKLVRVPLGEGVHVGHVEDVDVPATIEEQTEALARSREVVSVPVPTSTEDFHGDGADGQVAVVHVDRRLTLDNQAAALKHVRERDLCPTHHAAIRFGGGDLQPLVARRLAPTSGHVGGGGDPLASLVVESAHPQGVRLTTTTASNPSLAEQPGDHGPADSDPKGDRLLALAGSVLLDQVVRVDVVPFSGHVFNLESEKGWYLSDRLIVHNCRCTVALVIAGRGRAKEAPVPVAIAPWAPRPFKKFTWAIARGEA